jgi:hypothetical protein
MSKVSAEVDQVVSGPAWLAFPELHTAILRWANLVRSEAGGLLISAMPVGMDSVSVRVTSMADQDEPRDWVEWLAPMSLKGARQSAIDHFVSRSMATALDHLDLGPPPSRAGHDGTHAPAAGAAPRDRPPSSKEAPTMAKKKSPASTSKTPAPSRAAAPRAETRSAVATPAMPTTTKPGPRPRPSTARAAAKPAPAPEKPALEARSARPAATPAKAPARPAAKPSAAPRRGRK